MDELCVCTSHQACLAILFKNAVGNLAVLVAIDVTLTSGLFSKCLLVVAKHGVKLITSGHECSFAIPRLCQGKSWPIIAHAWDVLCY